MATTLRAASIQVLMMLLFLTRLSSSWATMVTLSPLPTNGSNFKTVDGHAIKSLGQVPKLNTSAGPCRLRIIEARIMPYEETNTVEGASCPGEIVLGNPILVHTGLNVTEFIAENIDRLSSLDYGNLHERNFSLAMPNLRRLRHTPWASPICATPLLYDRTPGHSTRGRGRYRL